MKLIEEIKLKDKVEIEEQMGLKFKVPKFDDMKKFTKILKDYLDDDTKTAYKKSTEEKVATGVDTDGKPIEEIKTKWIFDDQYYADLIYYTYIENLEFRDLKEYLDFIRDQDGTLIKYFDEFRGKTYHGFKSDTKMKCKACGKEESIEIPTDPAFFLE